MITRLGKSKNTSDFLFIESLDSIFSIISIHLYIIIICILSDLLFVIIIIFIFIIIIHFGSFPWPARSACLITAKSLVQSGRPELPFRKKPRHPTGPGQWNGPPSTCA